MNQFSDDMKQTAITKLGRIDRVVADNLPSIKESFGNHALLVQDFIVFITKNLKYNLFGFTEFTLKEFCDATSNVREVIGKEDPIFKDRRIKPPVKNQVEFSTVFDYALYLMMQRNIILSREYQTMHAEKVVTLKSIGVLTDVNIIIGKRGTKVYQVKLSNDLLKSFVSRYYTIDTRAYKLIGKGRGGINRKAFLIYICKIRHILHSQNSETTTVPVDHLAYQAAIEAKENKHTKQQLDRILQKLKDINFPFDYEFVSNKPGGLQYYVKFNFPRQYSNKQMSRENNFYFALLDELNKYFDFRYKDTKFVEKEPFQRWLNLLEVDTDVKIDTIKKLYRKFFQSEISDIEAHNFLKFGFIDNSEDDDVDFDFNPFDQNNKQTLGM